MLSVTKDREEEFDWLQIHRRLNAAWSTLEQSLAPDDTSQQQILRARANALAKTPAHGEGLKDNLEIVEFLLAYERYGVESRCVREVCPLKDLRPLAGTPPFILGLINVRGQIISVMDIKKFFDLPDKGLTDFNRVLVLRAGQMEAGILADSILTVRPIARSDLQPALPTLTGIRADYVKGITRDPTVILDVEKFLSNERIIVDEG
jgi:purine-binding chemotaxis protein CheW